MQKELVMYVVVRKDLNMPVGKLAAQCSHAILTAWIKYFCKHPFKAWKYFKNSQAKIVLDCKNEIVLTTLYNQCMDKKINCVMITDAGRTVFNEPTRTVIGVGPCHKDELPSRFSRLRLY